MGHRNILYLRLKNYFPFRIKMFNVTRLVYLNSVSEERLLPWFKDDYGEIVAQGMLFGEFEEDRLHNYLDMQGYKTGDNVDLSLIKAKYAEMTRQKV